MLLGGDFRQVLPVTPRVPPAVVIETSLKKSPLWSLFQQHHLIQNMRTRRGEQEFSAWLLQLGSGTLSADMEPRLTDVIEIPPSCCATTSLIEEIYAGISPDEMHNSVILSPKNEDCLHINEQVLNMLPGESRTYLSADSVKCDSEEERQNYPIEFLNSLTPSGMPPHVLNLKVGSIVMLL